MGTDNHLRPVNGFEFRGIAIDEIFEGLFRQGLLAEIWDSSHCPIWTE